ncbi:hypothetical protein [Arthrobacter sp. I3]|uniref:hypothetical protein n=1 Tax=Arthrobacter sp. I3 TaxID=218158 RepID=UPI0004B5E568|nr:hypothetical protein [Arthrobacter sp. I3]
MEDEGLREEAAHDAANVRLVLAQIEAGELEATPGQRHFLAGALAALEEVIEEHGA